MYIENTCTVIYKISHIILAYNSERLGVSEEVSLKSQSHTHKTELKTREINKLTLNYSNTHFIDDE